MNISIIPDHSHYIVYINGKFFCSADSVREAEKEIEKNYKGGK